MPISFPHLFLKYISICGICLFCITGTYVRGYAQPPIITLEGEQLGDIAWEDARAFTVVTRSTLNRLKKTDEGVPPDLQTLSDAAFAAFEKKRQLSRLSPVYTLYGNDARQGLWRRYRTRRKLQPGIKSHHHKHGRHASRTTETPLYPGTAALRRIYGAAFAARDEGCG